MKLLLFSLVLLGCAFVAAVEEQNQAGACNTCDEKGCRSVPCPVGKRDADGCVITCSNGACNKRCPGGCECRDMDCKKCDGGDCKKVASCPATREVVEKRAAVEEAPHNCGGVPCGAAGSGTATLGSTGKEIPSNRRGPQGGATRGNYKREDGSSCSCTWNFICTRCNVLGVCQRVYSCLNFKREAEEYKSRVEREIGEEKRAAVEEQNQAGACNKCDASGCRSVPCKREVEEKRAAVEEAPHNCGGVPCGAAGSGTATLGSTGKEIPPNRRGPQAGATGNYKREDGSTCNCDSFFNCKRCNVLGSCSKVYTCLG